jgi:hypothetical protein
MQVKLSLLKVANRVLQSLMLKDFVLEMDALASQWPTNFFETPQSQTS